MSHEIRIGRGPKANSLWEITRDPGSFRSILIKYVVDVNSTFVCFLALEYIDVTTKYERCETINTIMLENGELKNRYKCGLTE